METQPFRTRIKQLSPLIGTWINLIHLPAAVPVFKSSGLDFLRIDMEHSPPSIQAIADMALIARAYGFPIFVRPPAATREWLTRLLDCGVLNFHCPQVMSAKQAEGIAESVRFAPAGTRGNAGPSGGNDFNPGGWSTIGKQRANEQVYITAMIETGDALAKIDEIARVPGVDALATGPSDLAQDLGISGTPQEKEIMREKEMLVLEAAKRHSKAFSVGVNNIKDAVWWKRSGADIIACSSDVRILQRVYADMVQEFTTADAS